LGVILDTTVLIEAERSGQLNFVDTDISEIGIAAITAGELLVGVNRASPAARAMRRRVTIEALLAAIPIIPFDLAEARIYAEMVAELARQGLTIGTKDVEIAATAVARGWSVATLNRTDFARIPGVELAEPTAL
jgi:tRNA(fMet)-specific endonuclease VapC